MKKMGFWKKLLVLPIIASLILIGCGNGNGEPENVNGVSGVAVTSPGGNSVAVGGTLQLSAVVLPAGVGQGVTWTSSNAHATVTAGLVTGVSEGTSVITATSTVDPSRSGSITITVTTGGAPAGTIFAVTLPGSRSGGGTNAANPPAATSANAGAALLPGTMTNVLTGFNHIVDAGIIAPDGRERVFRITEAEFNRIVSAGDAAGRAALGIDQGYNSGFFPGDGNFHVANGLSIGWFRTVHSGEANFVNLPLVFQGHVAGNTVSFYRLNVAISGAQDGATNARMVGMIMKGQQAAFDDNNLEIIYSWAGLPPVVPVSVAITGGNRTKELGNPLTLAASVLPSGAPQGVTWTSSNTAVATIAANGAVTSLSTGITTIRATSTEDSAIFGEITLTVDPAAPPPPPGLFHRVLNHGTSGTASGPMPTYSSGALTIIGGGPAYSSNLKGNLVWWSVPLPVATFEAEIDLDIPNSSFGSAHNNSYIAIVALGNSPHTTAANALAGRFSGTRNNFAAGERGNIRTGGVERGAFGSLENEVTTFGLRAQAANILRPAAYLRSNTVPEVANTAGNDVANFSASGNAWVGIYVSSNGNTQSTARITGFRVRATSADSWTNVPLDGTIILVNEP